jgi:hypothetical protein
MKMDDALQITEERPVGFLVSFEHADGSVLRSDCFPDVRAGEPPIPTEEEAWRIARLFAQVTRNRCVNIYVIRSDDLRPVMGYRDRKITNR